MRSRLPPTVATLVLATFVLAFVMPPAANAADVKGAKDWPGIGRFKGSAISGYVAKDFDATTLQAAPFRDGKPVDERRLEGRVTRIAYRTGPGPSILEVSRNFENQLARDGFETLLACDTDTCGGIPFSERTDLLPIPQMWADGFNFRYVSAVKRSAAGETYAALLVSKNNDDVTAQLTMSVVGALENKMVDAAAMKKGLGEKGHIALYGIFFDTDKATIKPESKPTLDEMSKLLNGEPRLKVFIVGHTDSQGSYDHNMQLSRARADAVVAALIRSYGIARERLHAAGIGYLSPIGSNASDEGRALNRRVELVAP